MKFIYLISHEDSVISIKIEIYFNISIHANGKNRALDQRDTKMCLASYTTDLLTIIIDD